MVERNLPIQLVLQRSEDSKKKKRGGEHKFFGECTPEMQGEIINKLGELSEYYSDVFKENANVPAIGKIIVKQEAIAKSHKPNALCRNCNIIGCEKLGEIYIKVTAECLEKTIKLVQNPPSKELKANLTTIETIAPIMPEDKISLPLQNVISQGVYAQTRNRIKIKLFNFGHPFDNQQILNYVQNKMSNVDIEILSSYTLDYNTYLVANVQSAEDIYKIAQINGIKTIDYFQQLSMPYQNRELSEELKGLLLGPSAGDISYGEVIVGIIDSGISDNQFFKNDIYAREVYVPLNYQNRKHGTFVASTIQYGNILNNLGPAGTKRFKFLDVIVYPNDDASSGLTGALYEDDLMIEIREVMEKYADKVKLWNLSLGFSNMVCNDTMSDFGIFLDEIQKEFDVQFFISTGNLSTFPLRTWPPQQNMGNRDRLVSPADSVRALSVGALAHTGSCANGSIVNKDEPAPYSRRGPGANYMLKPDVVDYGGNFNQNNTYDKVGLKGLDIQGNIIEMVGTSFATPRILQKYGSLLAEMKDGSLLLAKALLIHSARVNSRDLIDNSVNSALYYGYGIPSGDIKDILYCNQHEITLIFNQAVNSGQYLEMTGFPYPSSLIQNNRFYGELAMTLVYDPVLDQSFGQEYCRTNIDVGFGPYKMVNGKMDYKSEVPPEVSISDRFEKAQVENSFKWSPVKSYYRKFVSGIQADRPWKLRVDMVQRNEISVNQQNFILIMTIKDPEQKYDIYSEVVNQLRSSGYITTNLETKTQIRQRQY